MKVKEKGEKVGLKFNIQKSKFMASGPITSWQIDGETMETVRDFISGGSKITVYGEWNHEIKRLLLLGRKAVANLNSILKRRDITLPTKAHLGKAMVFQVFMYGCESWAIKKAEHQSIDVFVFVVSFFLNFFYILFFNFTILYWFCHISTWKMVTVLMFLNCGVEEDSWESLGDSPGYPTSQS